MKKILTHLIGIVLLIAILIAGGCKSSVDSNYPPNVTIYLKAVEDDKEMKLLLSDSKDGTGMDAKTYYTDVGPGTKVVWRRADNSGIKSIRKVGPLSEKGPIFPGNAKTILGKRRRISVSDDAPIPSDQDEETVEQYEIIFKDTKNNKEWPIDPYLRIRGTDQLSQDNQ